MTMTWRHGRTPVHRQAGRDPGKAVVIGLAVVQLADAAGNQLVPARTIEAHLDHLGVPVGWRPALPWIKVSTALGLLAGLRAPTTGTVTSASLVGYYAAAVRFHLRAGDRYLAAAPAALCGAAALAALARFSRPTR